MSKLSKVIDLVQKIADKSAKKSTTSQKEAIRNSSRIKEAIEQESINNPNYLDELSEEEFLGIIDNLTPADRKSLNLTYGDEFEEAADSWYTSLSPEEVANDLQFFDSTDEIVEYTQGLNAADTRRFINSISDEDYELFGGFENMVKQLGPREVKNKGSVVNNKISKVMSEFKSGTLRSSSGDKVTDRGQAVAIALSEARTKKYSGGSMMDKPTHKMPDGTVMEGASHRSNYAIGSLVKTALKIIKPLNADQKQVMKNLTRKQQGYAKDMAGAVVVSGGVGYTLNSEKAKNLIAQAEAGEAPVSIVEVDERINPADYPKYQKDTESAEAFRKAFRSAVDKNADIFMFEGRVYNTEIKDKKYSGGKMKKYAEGSMLVPPEMEAMASEADVPVDTYPNIPPEEMDQAMASQLPDEEMMQEYIDFVVDESLEDEEKDYLMNALSQDPQLSQIFDKVVETASEFSGSGFVDGPGSGVSDSIPARLSAGEFVITKKATDQIGPENLQKMMDDAERAYDGGLMSRRTMDTTSYDTISDEEIRKQMLDANRMPSVR